MRFCGTIVALFCLVLLGAVAASGEELCPGAAEALKTGDHGAAEAQARACLEKSPGDVGIRMVLSKALGFQGRHDEALELVARIKAEAPENVEAMVWFARLLYWKGRTQEAYQSLDALKGDQADQETALLLGDLAAALKNPAEAETWYWAAAAKGAPRSVALLKVAGLRELEGREEEAAALVREACAVQDESSDQACRRMTEMGHAVGNLRWVVGVQPSYLSVLDRPDAWNFRGWIGGRPLSQLYVDLSGELRSRDFGQGSKRDFFLQGTGRYRFDRYWSLEVSAGGTIERVFSPTFTAYIEPWARLLESIEVSFRVWHLQFGDQAVEVLSPHMDIYFSDFLLDLRYYLSLSEDGTGHAGTGKLHWFTGPLRWNVGAGLGDKADYLDQVQNSDSSFWFLGAGVAWRLPTNTHVTFDYLYRDESVDKQSYRFHQYMVGLYQWF